MALVLTYGSSGSQGEPLTRKLLEAGHALRAVVRHPERAAALQARGAEVVKGDLSDFEGLNTASAGVDAVFLMMPFSAGGNPFELMGNALKAAKEGGAKLLVFNAGGHPPSAPTGIPTIILRPGVYMENFLGPSCLPSIQHRDAVAYPHRSAMRVSWIASDDLGAFAVAALERPELAGQRLTLSGPEAQRLPTPSARHWGARSLMTASAPQPSARRWYRFWGPKWVRASASRAGTATRSRTTRWLFRGTVSSSNCPCG